MSPPGWTSPTRSTRPPAARRCPPALSRSRPRRSRTPDPPTQGRGVPMTRATIATDLGDIEVELYDQSAPKATANFVKLAGDGFYDDVIFHRVIPGFVAQAGDGQYGKKSSLERGRVGTGGPGYKFEDEPVSGDYVRGALAMANAGPNTNGSQFFICHQDLTGKLPKNYTLFGQVTRGMDVVAKIVGAPRDGKDLPNDPVAMTSVTIHPNEGYGI